MDAVSGVPGVRSFPCTVFERSSIVDEGRSEQIKGEGEELKGKAKQSWGDLTGSESTQAEGKAEELKGKARKKIGEAQETLEDEPDREEGY
jgi:uncharacterized protein YjbJ (UPF0337 family)